MRSETLAKIGSKIDHDNKYLYLSLILGGLTGDTSIDYNKVKYFGQTCLELALIYSPDAADIYRNIFVNTTLEKGIMKMRREININNAIVGPNVYMGLHWFDNMTSYIGILRRLDRHLSKKILHMVEAEVQELDVRLSLNIIILVMVIVVSPLITYGVHKMASDTQAIVCRLQKVDLERQKADGILYQIFPKSVAECMKKNNAVSARHFKHTTVMFSDVVGFADISAVLTAQRLVDLLNRLYHTLDSAIDLYDVNKVESTGGAYQIVSGLPTTNGDKHAGEIASLALHFLSAANIFNPLYIGGKIRLRIGIHSGSCVAGVVGYKRPRYHIFGRTTNIAHKLQTSGEVGKIQISSATQQILETLGGYNVAKRIETPEEVKEMFAYEDDATYWLVGKDSSGRPGMLAKNALVMSYKGI
ncbi:atrial natriuretic peptide receptor 2-like [Branchiostoma lanceolatum]|uniref:atrial natriuretic peptide receptor 2-like n=1 Tax=Branchiostoma lanceolatum TaxID=7740 RepID=UPI003454344C